MKNRHLKQFIAVIALLGTGLAQAHPGHGMTTLLEGMAHPLALDHFLVMLAVGAWSICALPANRVWLGPLVFLLTLAGAAVLGAIGVMIPMLEHAVALSVVLAGVMLWLARQGSRQDAGGGGVLLVALMGGLHGLAHGAETPAGSFMAYASGFLLSTAVLHLLGLVATAGLRRMAARVVTGVIGALGTVIGMAGALLLAQAGA